MEVRNEAPLVQVQVQVQVQAPVQVQVQVQAPVQVQVQVQAPVQEVVGQVQVVGLVDLVCPAQGKCHAQ